MYNKPTLKSINQLIKGLQNHKEIVIGCNTLTLHNHQVVKKVFTTDLRPSYIPFSDLSSLMGSIYIWIN
jgi:hypothetical protein